MNSRVRDSYVQDTAVLVADNHHIIRIGLTTLIKEAGGMSLAGEASTGREALRVIDEVRPHVVVLDSAFPDMDGLEVLKEAKSRHAKLGLAVLSLHTDRDFCARAMRAGASAFITKGSSAEEILRGVRCAALGRRFVSADMAERLAMMVDVDDAVEPHELLSDREFEVLRHITDGMRISDIAENLCLSIKTVSTYRTRLLRKLAVPSTAHLVRYAIQHGLTT